jgi:hypothetical protein
MIARSFTRWMAVVACAGMLALSGCTAEDAPPPVPENVETKTSSPAAALTMVADDTDIGSAIQASGEVFEESAVVVVAPAGNPAVQELAARASVGMGVPLLVAEAAPKGKGKTTAPEPGARNSPLPKELNRLGASTIVAVGDLTGLPGTSEDGKGPTIVRVGPNPAALGKALGMQLGGSEPADVATLAAKVAVMAPGTPERDESAATTDDAVPVIDRAQPLDDVVALSIDAPQQIPAIATARAAGVPVHLLPATTVNPQTSQAVIDALHSRAAGKTLALGAAFQAEPALDWKIRSAKTGFQFPGGGQLLFGQRQYVALYGVPGTGVLGVLGEQDSTAAVQRARDMAALYQPLTDKTVVPMFEMMATVASATAGADGNYSAEIPIEELRPWIDEAAAAGLYVVIDLQPGRTDFLTQAQQYQPLLELPNVGLALDPEWRLQPDQVHLRQIGSVTAAEVNSVIQWLADLTSEKALPQKMLVLHQFQLRMIQDRPAIDMSRPEIGMVIHADGQGSQPAKQDTWNALRDGAPVGMAWGWKNFYDEDLPVLTPEQTMRNVSPVPDLVTYQ